AREWCDHRRRDDLLRRPSLLSFSLVGAQAGATLRAPAPARRRENLLALAERAGEEVVDGAAAILFELPRACACEVCMGDGRQLIAREPGPVALVPLEPRVLPLVEDVERLVAELGELRAPARAALDRLVFEYLADDVNLLALIDLIPDALQDFAERRAVGVAAVHQPRDVFEADVAGL